LRGKPVIVGWPGERSVVCAASYEARKFGIHSAMPATRARRLCPEAEFIHPNFDKYRTVSRQIRDVFERHTPLVEPLSLDEAYLDVTENLWGEPLAQTIAVRIKRNIFENLGLTASAGVAPNKFLAKIASGWEKPDGLTVIAPERVEKFLQQLPVEALWGVGPVTAKKLRAIGIERLVEIRAVDRNLLAKTVGSLADWLVTLSHGEDPRQVKPDRESKSVSCETTYAEDLTDLGEMNQEIARLARELAAELESKGIGARTVTIKVRYADFTTVTRSHTEDFFTCSKAEFVNRAQMLLERTDAAQRPIRLLGVGAHGLAREASLLPLWEERP
ncbi:MAG TPA: DNA polymerase IV, partial [Burkholderiales bacterium]|nr:DNA polymerase IV [Burkholderiales bacterium]